MAIETNESSIDHDIASEMRSEYLEIVNRSATTFQQKKDELYNKIVKPIYHSLRLKPTLSEYTFEIINEEKSKIKTIGVESTIICIGRFPDNDVFVSDDKSISRMHGYMFTAGDKMVFLDIWSLHGTQTIQRSNRYEKCLSTLPDKRNILMFDKNEIIHLKITKCVDLLIIPKNANQKKLKSFAIYKDITKLKNKVNVEKSDNIDDEKKNDQKEKKEEKILNVKQQKFKQWICDELDLSEYYNLFLKNGFDDIDVVKLLDDNDLKQLGIDKKGSRMKLMLYAKREKEKSSQNDQQYQTDNIDQYCSAMIGK